MKLKNKNEYSYEVIKTNRVDLLVFMDIKGYEIDASFKLLQYSCEYGSFEVLKWLFKNLPQIQTYSYLQVNLARAVRGGNLMMLKWMLKKSPHVLLYNLTNPISTALKIKRLDMFNILIGRWYNTVFCTKSRTNFAGHIDLAISTRRIYSMFTTCEDKKIWVTVMTFVDDSYCRGGFSSVRCIKTKDQLEEFESKTRTIQAEETVKYILDTEGKYKNIDKWLKKVNLC